MLIAMLVFAGLAAITLLVMYVLLRHSMQKETARLRAELSLVLASRKPVRGAAESLDETRHQAHNDNTHSLTPEELCKVAATLSAFLGSDVRISAVTDGPAATEAHHSWAQQGCVAIQNSHDLAIAKQAVSRSQVSVRRHVA
jgi:hypothetical protein